MYVSNQRGKGDHILYRIKFFKSHHISYMIQTHKARILSSDFTGSKQNLNR